MRSEKWGGLRAGAGRPGNARLVEDARRLDVRQMQKAGLFRAPWQGMWWWKNPQTLATTSTISVRTSQNHMLISYEVGGTLVRETIDLSHAACGFGGTRVLMQCPGCRQHCSVMYFANRNFRCRQCHRLSYESQSESRLGRLAIKKQKILRRLGPHGSRRKGMNLDTYRQRFEKLVEVEFAIDDEICRLL
ncbi:MAG: hypothetical protein K5880_09130 [Hydrogenophaga sp.]|uniref:hypothetical protein n=1 Tax=Hydrogenophaga sp. TaxID=1904254 RepID=UPI00260F85A9|nr:hypothetical protein [Hydrogenophaga sp.]MCV0438784.1 hypothetical protein [Hydrogenophaga sp.]